MSGFSDTAKDHAQAQWIAKWVPEGDDELPDPTMEQYRYTLARARAAEDELKLHQTVLRELRNLMGRG